MLLFFYSENLRAHVDDGDATFNKIGILLFRFNFKSFHLKLYPQQNETKQFLFKVHWPCYPQETTLANYGSIVNCSRKVNELSCTWNLTKENTYMYVIL